MTRIESLLRKEIGLDAASIGSSQIHRVVRLRMKHAGLTRVEDYEKRLRTSPGELNELIESVVVTETWFFRDREPFAAFAQLAMSWLGSHPGGTLRVLSVPCSTGEEPYSLAMTLLDAGLAPHRFAIDAADISARSLARAGAGVYGKNSFRGAVLSFRDRHFQSGREGYTLNSRVRACVRFHHANLLGDSFLNGQAQYDFVFCRNLLIYFDRATQELALERIRGLLDADGVLFVGPAELPLATENGYANANVPMAFACRVARKAGQKKRANALADFAPLEPEPIPAFDARPSPPPVKHVAPAELAVARQLAEAGQLAEAANVCEKHLRQKGPSAEAYYLLGLVRDAHGDPKAVDFYRKALYLQPDHYETLLQLSLLLEKNGDETGARTYKRRAERAQPKAG